MSPPPPYGGGFCVVMNDLLLNAFEGHANRQYKNSAITNVQLNYMSTMDYRRQANPQLTRTVDAVLTIKDVLGNGAKAIEIMSFLKNNEIKKAIIELGKELGKNEVRKYNGK